jgi:hypothetical protein
MKLDNDEIRAEIGFTHYNCERITSDYLKLKEFAGR